MKKTTFIVAMLFFVFLGSNVYGQNYKSAVGARFGYVFNVDYKMSIKESLYLDAYGGIFYSSLYGGASLLVHKPIREVENLYWYYGGGAFFTLNDGSSFGINGSLGLDYSFTEIPLNLSIDWMPAYRLGSSGGFVHELGGLAVRYILGRS